MPVKGIAGIANDLVMRTFFLGYSPRGWSALVDFSVDQVCLYKLLHVRIFDFLAVNRKPGAIIYWEPIELDPREAWIPEDPMEVELTELRVLRLARIA
jgi:hypothetical protein